MQISTAKSPFTTWEGYYLLPNNNLSSPKYYLTPQLLSAFEPADTRFSNWIDSTFTTNYYYYPRKYKQRQGEPGVTSTEDYIMLRLAEQYLIRAEARARQNDLPGAIADLNIIRQRAGLADLSETLNGDEVLAAVNAGTPD